MRHTAQEGGSLRIPAPASGDGWQVCAAGHRHWGRFGAAGVLVVDGGDGLLQLRSHWTHEGGTWAVPGGARHETEDDVAAALREAGEEIGLPPDAVRPTGWVRADHDGWAYTTVVTALTGPGRPPVRPRNRESTEVRWWPVDDVAALPLHDGFRAVWPALRAAPPPLVVVVDVANVVGSRPDGWWRDRAGAAARLLGALVSFAAAGVPVGDRPDGVAAGGWAGLFPGVRPVLEGRFRAAPRPAAPDTAVGWPARQLRVVTAPAAGDDTIVEVAGRDVDAGRQVLVVTADRELRQRCVRAGAAVVGPGWLLDRLPAPTSPSG